MTPAQAAAAIIAPRKPPEATTRAAQKTAAPEKVTATALEESQRSLANSALARLKKRYKERAISARVKRNFSACLKVKRARARATAFRTSSLGAKKRERSNAEYGTTASTVSAAPRKNSMRTADENLMKAEQMQRCMNTEIRQAITETAGHAPRTGAEPYLNYNLLGSPSPQRTVFRTMTRF